MMNQIHPEAAELLRRIDERLTTLNMSDLAATKKAGIGYDAIRGLRRGKNRSLNALTLAKLATALEVTPNQLLGVEPMPEFSGTLPDKPVRRRASPKSEVSAPFKVPEIGRKRIPVLGLAVGGDDGRFIMNGEVIDTTFCPPGYEDVPDLYAVFVSGSSMEPRFEPGETVWVHPRKPPRKGNYVVVQLYTEPGEPPEGYVKRFVRYTPTKLVLDQFNPSKEIEFDRDEVLSVHPIVFQGVG